MIFLYILLGIFILIFLCLSLPITVMAGYDDHFYIKVQYLFFLFNPLKKEKKIKKIKPKKDAVKTSKKNIPYFDDLFKKQSLPDAIVELCSLLRIFFEKFAAILKRSTMQSFSLTITEYNADAATAAINYGRICAVVYPFLGFLNSLMPFKSQNVQIFCDYNSGKSNFQFDLKWKVIPILCIGPIISFVFDLIKNKGR